MFNKILRILLAIYFIDLGIGVYTTGRGRIIYGYYADFGDVSVIAGPSFIFFGVLILLYEILAILKKRKFAQQRGGERPE